MLQSPTLGQRPERYRYTREKNSQVLGGYWLKHYASLRAHRMQVILLGSESRNRSIPVVPAEPYVLFVGKR